MLYRQFSDISRRQKLLRLRLVAQDALTRYPIDVDNLRFYGEHSNVLYTVTSKAGRRYMLKIARPGDHSLTEIDAALQWLREANKAEIENIIEVVPTANGALSTTVEMPFTEEPRYCSLYTWAPGRNLADRVTGNTAQEWGALSARLHRFSQTQRFEPTGALMRWDRVFYWDEEVLFSDEYRDTVGEMRLSVFAKAVDAVQKEMDQLYYNSGPQTTSGPILVHGDLHPDNVKVDHGTLWAIDFEDVMWAYPQQDIAISLLYVRRRPNFDRILDRFRAGYELILPWPAQDFHELHTYFIARILMFANFIIKLPDLDEDTSSVLDRYCESCVAYLR